jgi:DNA-binding beta-propeller fold protein YncE
MEAQKHKEVSIPICESCGEREVSITCAECQTSECHDCDVRMHKHSSRAKHIRFPYALEKKLGGSNPLVGRCSLHGAYPLDLVCKEKGCGDRLICIMCHQFGDHAGHHAEMLKKEAGLHRARVVKQRAAICLQIDAATAAYGAVSEVVTSLAGNASLERKGTLAAAEAKIRNEFGLIREVLDQREASLLAGVRAVYQRKNEQLTQQLGDLGVFLTNAYTLVRTAEMASKQEDDRLFYLHLSEVMLEGDPLPRCDPVVNSVLEITFNNRSVIQIMDDTAQLGNVSEMPSAPAPITKSVVKHPEVSESEGTFVRQWGSKGTGNGKFDEPAGVAISVSTREIFVTDYNNHRIQVFGTDGKFVRGWGYKGIYNSQFNNPLGVAVSTNSGQVYCTDVNNHRVQVFSLNGDFVRTWGERGSGVGQFNKPWGVAVSSTSNEVFVTDVNNHRVQVFDVDGNFIRAWGGVGAGQGQFSNPRGVAVSTSNEVFVTDYNNHRIQVFDLAGNFIRVVGSKGEAKGKFNNPLGIAVSAGELFVTDYNNHRVQVFTLDGCFVRAWGSAGDRIGQFNNPWGIAASSLDSCIYVTDLSNHRVQVFI